MKLSLSNRRGIALPMAILVITALDRGRSRPGFISAASEYSTNAAERGQNRAYHLAQTALEQFMVSAHMTRQRPLVHELRQ